MARLTFNASVEKTPLCGALFADGKFQAQNQKADEVRESYASPEYATSDEDDSLEQDYVMNAAGERTPAPGYRVPHKCTPPCNHGPVKLRWGGNDRGWIPQPVRPGESKATLPPGEAKKWFFSHGGGVWK